MGLMRGLDLFSHERGTPTMARCGVCVADGGGAEGVARAITFAELGYRTALLRDNDVKLLPAQLAAIKGAGIRIFQWKDDQAFEGALFHSCPTAAIPELLDIAIEARTYRLIYGPNLTGNTHWRDAALKRILTRKCAVFLSQLRRVKKSAKIRRTLPRTGSS
jgi:hypothetical protein